MNPATNQEPPEAWVKLPSEEAMRSASGGRQHPYEIFMGGVVARMARLLAAHPRIGGAFRQLSAEVLFGPGALSRAEREMVAAVTAAAQDCFY
jgi:Carboxymuconolactone decarboxylase family